MNRQSIHQQIDLLINTLKEKHEPLKHGNGSIQQAELDLLLQNTRQLYEAILMLNHANALSSLDEVKNAVMQRLLAEKKMFEKKPEASGEMFNAEEIPFKKEAFPETIPERSMEEQEVKTPIVHAADDKKDKSVKQKKLSGGVNATLFQDAPKLADQFHDGESLHEHIASKGGKTLADNIHRKPIHDLKASIGINEKFLFINQLFDGNLQDYSETVDKLNSAGNLEAAKEFIAVELASRFNWPDNDEHVKHFMDLVERRFIS